MPRRRYEDDEDDDTPRRRGGSGSKAPLFVGIGVAVTAVIVAVIVTVVIRRGGRAPEDEVVIEDGVRVVTERGREGIAGSKRYLPPADGRPYGMRTTKDDSKPDRTVLTEGWGMMVGRWERTDEFGRPFIADFRPDYTATVTVQFAEGIKTGEYALSCIDDKTAYRSSDMRFKRRYLVDLRIAGEQKKFVHFHCDIHTDGSLWMGPSSTFQYKRVR